MIDVFETSRMASSSMPLHVNSRHIRRQNVTEFQGNLYSRSVSIATGMSEEPSMDFDSLPQSQT